MAKKINDLNLALAMADEMQLETDTGGLVANKITWPLIKTNLNTNTTLSNVAYLNKASNTFTGSIGTSSLGTGDGATATPSITFTSTPTTGFYNSGTNRIYGSISGTCRFIFDENGICSTLGTTRLSTLSTATTSDTVPNILPNYTDSNTGIGRKADDTLNLIAGGVNIAEFTTTLFDSKVAVTAPSLTLTTTPLGVSYGGTGQTSYTDGQLLIGNSTGNTLKKASLSAGTGISITPGSGSITITNTSIDPAYWTRASSTLTPTTTNDKINITAASAYQIGSSDFIFKKNTSNIFIGTSTSSIAAGTNNVSVGDNSGDGINNGSGNSCFGNDSGTGLTSGSTNTLIGYRSGRLISTSNGSTMVGNASGYSTTGYGNVFFGYQTGYSITTGTANIFLGYSIGYTALGNVSNTLAIGNSDTATPIILGTMGANFASQSLTLGGLASYASAPTFTSDNQIITKKYADDLIVGAYWTRSSGFITPTTTTDIVRSSAGNKGFQLNSTALADTMYWAQNTNGSINAAVEMGLNAQGGYLLRIWADPEGTPTYNTPFLINGSAPDYYFWLGESSFNQDGIFQMNLLGDVVMPAGVAHGFNAYMDGATAKILKDSLPGIMFNPLNTSNGAYLYVSSTQTAGDALPIVEAITNNLVATGRPYYYTRRINGVYQGTTLSYESLANNADVDVGVPPFYGWIEILDADDGYMGIWKCGGSSGESISDTPTGSGNTTVFSNTKDTASKINIYFEGTPSSLRVQNKAGYTLNVSVNCRVVEYFS